MTNTLDKETIEKLADIERENYAYNGKPLAWKQGFDIGFKEGAQTVIEHVGGEAVAEVEHVSSVIKSKLGDMCFFRSFEAKKGDKVYLEPPALEAENARLKEALNRLCTYEPRTSKEIDDAWDFARKVLKGQT